MWFGIALFSLAHAGNECSQVALETALRDMKDHFTGIARYCEGGDPATKRDAPLCGRSTGAFNDAARRLDRTMACLKDPITDTLAAALHGARALEMFVNRSSGDKVALKEEQALFVMQLQAARALDPKYQPIEPTLTQFPAVGGFAKTCAQHNDEATHAIWSWFCVAEAELKRPVSPPQTQLWAPVRGTFTVDGRTNDHPYVTLANKWESLPEGGPETVDAPMVLQWTYHKQIVGTTYVPVGGVQPLYPRRLGDKISPARVALGATLVGLGTGIAAASPALSNATKKLENAEASTDATDVYETNRNYLRVGFGLIGVGGLIVLTSPL